MKGKTMIALLVVCIFIMYSSCYKTGEVIYQPTCKPDSISVGIPLYFFYNLIPLQTFQGSLTYDVNRRLTGATSYVLGVRDRQFEFIYDNNDNLIRINIYTITLNNPNKLTWYITLSYPSGTTASLSTTAQVQVFLWFDQDQIFRAIDFWTYNFNAEYQLESIYQGDAPLRKITYDFGGNCLTDSLYFQGGPLFAYYVYSAYDNGINPARSDRTLQLLFNMYSKNNPTNSVGYGVQLGSNSFIVESSSSGNYTYDNLNYPVTYGGVFFAHYNCVVAPPPGSTLPPPIKFPN